MFRFETFGDEKVWTDTLRIHEVVEKSVDPTTALKVGLKVDADALPPGTLDKADLKSPATTVALLKMNAVVGLQATVDSNNHITRLGCPLRTVPLDGSILRLPVWAGVGRLANRDLNVGAIIALSPALPADKKAVYTSWAPANTIPDTTRTGRTLRSFSAPRTAGADQERKLYPRRGRSPYWNAYVRVTQMGDRATSPIRGSRSTVNHSPDLVHPTNCRRCARISTACRRLRLQPEASMRPRERVTGGVRPTCASCHVGGSGTDNTTGKCMRRRRPASTAPTGADGPKAYRTLSLRGLWQHAPYFHDGSAATLADVVRITTVCFSQSRRGAAAASLSSILIALKVLMYVVSGLSAEPWRVRLPARVAPRLSIGAQVEGGTLRTNHNAPPSAAMSVEGCRCGVVGVALIPWQKPDTSLDLPREVRTVDGGP